MMSDDFFAKWRKGKRSPANQGNSHTGANHVTPSTLHVCIRPLAEYQPRTRDMEQAICVGTGFGGTWYRSQKEHWLGWLAAYDGAAARDRSGPWPRNARNAYNHIECAPMLFWLAEALGAEEERLEAAYDAVLSAKAKGAPQCVALRRSIPWTVVESRLAAWPFHMPAQRERVTADFDTPMPLA